MWRREQKKPGLARVSESSWRLLGICINFLLSAGETTVAGDMHVGGEVCVHVNTHPSASPSIAPPPQLPHLSTFSPLFQPLEFAVRKKKVISPPMWLLVLVSVPHFHPICWHPHCLYLWSLQRDSFREPTWSFVQSFHCCQLIWFSQPSSTGVCCQSFSTTICKRSCISQIQPHLSFWMCWRLGIHGLILSDTPY